MADHLPIYIVDDDEDDLVLLRYCLQHCSIQLPFEFHGNGENFIAWLEKRTDPHPLPFILLLDLKMPKVDGFDVLAWLKKDPRYAKNPVVILSSSNMAEDVQRAYALGASWYLQKPCTLEQYHQLVHRFALFCEKISEQFAPHGNQNANPGA